jgi:hypothetical protein
VSTRLEAMASPLAAAAPLRHRTVPCPAFPRFARFPPTGERPTPETAKLGITLRGLRKLRARLKEDFDVGTVFNPVCVVEADWPDRVEDLRTEQVNTAWVEVVSLASKKRLIELPEYVPPEDVAPPQMFISHACEC